MADDAKQFTEDQLNDSYDQGYLDGQQDGLLEGLRSAYEIAAKMCRERGGPVGHDLSEQFTKLSKGEGQ
jgi:hypothetical protein